MTPLEKLIEQRKKIKSYRDKAADDAAILEFHLGHLRRRLAELKMRRDLLRKEHDRELNEIAILKRRIGQVEIEA